MGSWEEAKEVLKSLSLKATSNDESYSTLEKSSENFVVIKKSSGVKIRKRKNNFSSN